MTYYSLVVGDDEEHVVPPQRCEEVLGWLDRDDRFRGELEDFHERGANGYTKWYDHDRDVLRLSRAFPEILFVLWGEGKRPRICGNAITSGVGCKKRPPGLSIRPSI